MSSTTGNEVSLSLSSVPLAAKGRDVGTMSEGRDNSIEKMLWISGVGGENDAAVEVSDRLSRGSGSCSDGSAASTGDMIIEGEITSATISEGLLSNTGGLAPPSLFSL